jgi:hypothetical protein
MLKKTIRDNVLLLYYFVPPFPTDFNLNHCLVLNILFKTTIMPFRPPNPPDKENPPQDPQSLSHSATTHEYPPSFSQNRPLRTDRSRPYPSALRLRHHFFLTRLKIILKDTISMKQTSLMERKIQQEIVRMSLILYKFS